METFEREKFFFHYTTAEAAFEHILPFRKLRLSRYLEMRDPLENKEWAFSAAAWGGNEEDQNAAYFKFGYLANEVKRRAHLLSLTMDAPTESLEEEPFDRGWARPRMWEQYADRHAGACLVFDREKLIDEIQDSFARQGFGPVFHGPVDYESGGNRPFIQLDQFKDGEVDPAEVDEYIQQNREALFFQKALDWQTEYEYRFMTTPPFEADEFTGIRFQPVGLRVRNSLTAVIVGEQFPDWQRTGAIVTAEQAGIGSYRVEWATGLPYVGPLRPRSRGRGAAEDPAPPSGMPSDLENARVAPGVAQQPRADRVRPA